MSVAIFYLLGQESSVRKGGDELPLTLFFFKIQYNYEKNSLEVPDFSRGE